MIRPADRGNPQPPLRLKRLGKNSAARLLFARALLQDGQHERAQRETESVLRANPECAMAHFLLGLIRQAEEDPAGAARSLALAVRLDKRLGDAWLALACARRDLGHFPLALEAVDRSLSLDDSKPQGHLLRSDLLADLGRHGEAIAACDAAIRGDSALDAAHHRIARLHRDTGAPAAALQAARLARELNPSSADHAVLLGDLCRDGGDREGAVREYQAAVRLDPQNADLRARLADLFLELGWESEALLLLSWAIKLDPKSSGSYAALGRLYASLQRNGEAVEMLLTAARLNPRLPRLAEESTALEQALEGEPPSGARDVRRALAHLVRGIVYAAEERRGDAAQALQRALQLDPRLTEADVRLQAVLAPDHAA
jgi:tetratricopeptide (TPR) repeat protein